MRRRDSRVRIARLWRNVRKLDYICKAASTANQFQGSLLAKGAPTAAEPPQALTVPSQIRSSAAPPGSAIHRRSRPKTLPNQVASAASQKLKIR
jgi:hypothetical protein